MTGPKTKEDFEALRALETEWLAGALENTFANLGYPVGMGATLSEADSRKAAAFLFNRYLMMFERVAKVASADAVALWKLLDDIDTLDDACKDSNADFRNRCYEIQRKRFGILSGEAFDALSQGATAMKREEELTVSVKPLEWLSDREPFFASSPFCRYRIVSVDDDTGPHWDMAVSYEGRTYSRLNTEEDAKAAAQADYEARIRSALLPIPKPEAEPVAWVHPEAGWACENWQRVRIHCKNDGPMPIPLYAHPPKPEATLDDLAGAGAIESMSFSASENDRGAVTVHQPKPEATEGGAHEKGIEAAARAMCDAWHYAKIGTPDGDAEWKRKQDQYRKQAKAAIDAYRAALTAKQTDGRDG